MKTTVVFLLALVVGCGGQGRHADDVPPCSAAAVYRGAPLVAAPARADWPALDAGSNWTTQPAGPDLAAALAATLERVLRESGAPAVTAAVGGPGLGLWWATAGLARTQPPLAADAQSLFTWDSVGKAYTAALALDAAERGTLALADPVARWWPAFPEGEHITLDHLLHHTSGINRTEFETPPPHPHRTPDESIADAQAAGSLFCPGAYWRYSNLGYVMLARALEMASGASHGMLMQQRIFGPLGLQHSAVLEGSTLPAGLVWRHGPGNVPDHEHDRTGSTPIGAGAVVARADDVLRFWHAWLGGGVLPQAAVWPSFERLYPMVADATAAYGRGVMLMQFTDNRGRARRWLGHRGGTPGSNTVVAFDPALGLYVAVAFNSAAPSSAAALQLLDAAEEARGQPRQHGGRAATPCDTAGRCPP